ncbi:hypothetical protein [Streptomyces cavernicola]|uniref:hypothetical protein n=1 Tax=Streptomyces cavernicola TaxID=3043613 RepID=UPI0038D01B70
MHRTQRVRPRHTRRRNAVAVLAAAAAALVGLHAPVAQAAPSAATPSAPKQASTPLPPELEKIRAAEATQLYGDSAERPLSERKSALISLGDSEISGEGIGTYEPPTNGPDNWCHRSADAAIHKTAIPADVTYNVSCSGAYTLGTRPTCTGWPSWPV